jgi:branched-chain amino acid transport system ATP-binding protein
MTPALELSHVSKSFGGLPATKDVSLSVASGERRLIIGPNGAGKTTLFNLITGDLRRDAGSIRLFGREVGRMKTHERAQCGLARTYQIITLFQHDTLEHNLVLSLLGRAPARWNAFRPLARYSNLRESASEFLRQVGLENLAQRRLSALSYGERRRAEIAMALAQRPRVLLLDEPLAGLSRDERAALRTLILAIPREVTLVMIEHDMDTALDLAETITVLHYGRVIVEGSRADVVSDPRTREVYLGD